jgi:hypothetical protein
MRGLMVLKSTSAENPTQIAAENPSRMYIGRRSATDPHAPLVVQAKQKRPGNINAASLPPAGVHAVGPPRYAKQIPGEPVPDTFGGPKATDPDTLSGPLSKGNQIIAT